MKKYLLYIIISMALFTSCRKAIDPAPGERPEERTAAALKKYDDALTGSQYGWKAYLYPQGGGGFSFYMKFTPNNRVTMFADITDESTQKSMESSYRLKSVLAPSLLFDTYTYMHILADPSPEVFGGTAGWGLYSDFEFSIDTIAGDSIKLRGNLLDSKLILVKAKQAEADAYNAKGLNTLVNDVLDYTDANRNLFVKLGDDTQVQASVNASTKVFSLSWVVNDQVSLSSSAFAFTLTGIILQQPVIYKGKKIYELTWDAGAKQLYAIVDGAKVVVQVSPTPIVPLHLSMGISYSTITVPNATTYPGWSNDFVTRHSAAAAAMLAGPYGLRLDRMRFVFNTLSNSMNITADVYQGSNLFLANFPYDFTKTKDGVYKFTAGDLSGNAGLIKANMAPLTTQRLNSDTFTLNYFINPNTGATLGQFTSAEHPDFTFTGALN
jgi:hypothetical protein